MSDIKLAIDRYLRELPEEPLVNVSGIPIPVRFADKLCPGDDAHHFIGYSLVTLPDGFKWWVPVCCLRPRALAAINARLIRECDFCEEYFYDGPGSDLCQACR